MKTEIKRVWWIERGWKGDLWALCSADGKLCPSGRWKVELPNGTYGYPTVFLDEKEARDRWRQLALDEIEWHETRIKELKKLVAEHELSNSKRSGKAVKGIRR